MESVATARLTALGGPADPVAPLDAAELGRRIRTLPPLSTAALQLSQQLTLGKSAGELERTLRSDPALAANVLRVANSAAYSRGSAVKALRDAVVRLGRRGLDAAVISFALRRALPVSFEGYAMSAQQFLVHSVAVGTLAERLAKRVKAVDPEVVFTAGLLHEVGMLVLSQVLSARGLQAKLPAPEAARTPAAGWAEVERATIGTDHTEAGRVLAIAWKLPSQAVCAIRWHHQPLMAPDPKQRSLAAVIHVADQVEHLLGQPVPPREPVAVQPGVWEHLGLPPATLEELAGEALDEIEARSQALGVEADLAADTPEEIDARARAMLGEK